MFLPNLVCALDNSGYSGFWTISECRIRLNAYGRGSLWFGGSAVPVSASELMQRVRQVQTQLESLLGVAVLPRARDRVQAFAWGAVPLTWDAPRFGAVETTVPEQPQRGWQVTLSEELREEPEHVIEWVLWREALLMLLLPHVRQIPEVADLGLYAGLRLGDFSGEKKQALMELWARVSPPQHHVYYIYDAPYGFPLFDGVVDGAFLQRVVAWLNRFRASVVAPLTSASYTEALEQWMLETHIPLRPNEVRILSVLAKAIQFKQTELARQLNMLPSALSPALAKLAQRHILRLYNFIDLPLIGLIPFEVLLRVRDPKTRSEWIKTLSSAQYVYSVTTLQQDWILGRLHLPTDHISDIQRWTEDLSWHEEISSAYLFKTTELNTNWNFDHYVPGVGWIDDFSLIMEGVRSNFLDFRSSIDEEFISRHVYSYNHEKQKPFELRPEDFIYFRRAIDIVFATDRVSPQLSQEIRDAGFSESVYRRRVQKLEEQNISKLGGLWLLHIGLDTAIQIFLFESRDTSKAFIHAICGFPNISGALYERENGRVRMLMPNLQAVEVLSFLRKLAVELELNLLVEAKPFWKSVTGLEYPIKESNYDYSTGTWKWDDSILTKSH